MRKALILGVASVLVLAGCGQNGNNQEGTSMENAPQSGAGQQQAPSQSPEQGQQQAPPQPQEQGQQQQVSLNDQAEAALSQGEALLDQYGDSLNDDEKSELEGSLGDLEELSKQDDITPEEFQSAMENVQEDIQPISDIVQEQQESQQQQLPE